MSTLNQHTVEKIGGTSMSRFGEIMDNVIIGDRAGEQLYNRVFVVSAYSGMTNMLLEHKKSGQGGVYALFSDPDAEWEESLDLIKVAMCEKNAELASIGLDVIAADTAVIERIEGIRSCLKDLDNVCTYGHFQVHDFQPAVREMLAAIGEFHSAWNSVNILQSRGVNARLIDLTGWRDHHDLPFSEKITKAFETVKFSEELCIATGYTKCSEGLMKSYDRGYSEITFSKIACVTQACEGVIHKEFHLSSADPNLVGIDKVRILGNTNFDVADQLADLGMEAIHPGASKDMENMSIPIRVANAFEPDHPGTLITGDFKSAKPRVEMVTGRKDIIAIEVNDPDMVAQSGYDYRIIKHLADLRISYTAKNTNANTITHYVPKKQAHIQQLIQRIHQEFPTANVRTIDVAVISAIGSNMTTPGFLSCAAEKLTAESINILAVNQCMRQVNMQFIVALDNYEKAVIALHRGLVEEDDKIVL